MTLFFTEGEKKFLAFDISKEYPFSCKKDAPKAIKESINKKIEGHKKWLSSNGKE